MAKAITHIEKKIPNQAEEQADSLLEILTLVAKNKEALKTSLEILQELQHSGVLNIVKGLLQTRDKVGVLAVEQLNQPSMHNTIKNSINLLQIIGEIEPEKLKVLLRAANTGLTNLDESKEKITKWGLIKRMNNSDVLYSLSVMTGFLQGLGKELNNQKQHLH